MSSATGGVPVMRRTIICTMKPIFLNYVLDELMPWHIEDGLKDFSLLEVNRYMPYLL